MNKVKLDDRCECAVCGRIMFGYAWRDGYTEALICADCEPMYEEINEQNEDEY